MKKEKKEQHDTIKRKLELEGQKKLLEIEKELGKEENKKLEEENSRFQQLRKNYNESYVFDNNNNINIITCIHFQKRRWETQDIICRSTINLRINSRHTLAETIVNRTKY